MPTTVAVIVVNWNGGALLERCLDCLDRQTRPPDRIIVVDNGSRDDSLERLRRRKPRVQVIERPGNEGFARANNLGVDAAADCEWVALVNPDAFPEPGWLEALVRAAADRPDCASFGSHVWLADAPGRLDGIGDVYHTSGVAWRNRHALPAGDAPAERGEIFSACAAAALYRKAAFLEVGGFDESYFCYYEDVDLGFRLRLRGHRCLYVPDAVVHHTGSASAGRTSDFAIYHGGRNQVWTFFKDMPAVLLLLYLPQHLVWHLAALCGAPFYGCGRIMARAKWDALRGLPAVLRRRRAVQATRRAGLRELRRAMTTGILRPYLRQLEQRRVAAEVSSLGPRPSRT